jgi:hypothetical protein
MLKDFDYFPQDFHFYLSTKDVENNPYDKHTDLNYYTLNLSFLSLVVDL